MEEKDINRMMLHYEQLYKTSNRECINPEIEALSIDDLKPIVNMVSKSRADYLKFTYELGKKYGEGHTEISADELKKLKVLRLRFTELSEASIAFETSIQRGYLDLKID